MQVSGLQLIWRLVQIHCFGDKSSILAFSFHNFVRLGEAKGSQAKRTGDFFLASRLLRLFHVDVKV